jgi:subfamily B ATP-binding cassette protein MsbA
MLYGFKYLTATNQVENTEEKVFTSTKKLTRYHKRTGVANAFTQSIQEPIALLLILIIIFLQVSVFNDPLAPLLVSLVLFYRGINAAVGVQALWQGTLEFIGSMELVHDEFENQKQNKDQNGEQKVRDFLTISAHNLVFKYGNESHASSEAVLSGISFEIQKNSITAFVGESGAGKSTILDLIAMIHKPSSGILSVDGISSDTIDCASWRKNIGYVSQETIIFNDTIENNIALSANFSPASSEVHESVKEAAKRAQIHDVIESLPNKYQTMVGDRGMRLSGGQKQRLCIARELYRKPKILLLDEATSALDSESQNLIQKSLETLHGSVTIIIISHRFSTIRSADKIFVLEKGKIVEEGSFLELQARKDGVFARMSDSQRIHE